MINKRNPVLISYVGIVLVILIWGLVPLAKKALIGDSFSAAVYSTITTFSAACVLLVLSRSRLSEIGVGYFRVAVPTGLCVGLASVFQAVAYNFDTSPTNQAFLENLSCITVPVILLFAVRKRPSALTVGASVVCLFSSMVLAGVLDTGLSFRTADILNALAGLLYGVNIAVTGIYAKKYRASLYVMIQLFIQAAVSAMMALTFNFVCIGGEPIDPFVFTPVVWLVLCVAGIGILANAVCWTVRTSAMRYVSANVVAVMMPFSAVITGVAAVIVGQDRASSSLIIGAVLGLAASLMSSVNDIRESKISNDDQ